MVKLGKREISLGKWLAALGALILGYIVFMALMQRPASDISIHAAWAQQGSFANPKTFVYRAAHPLWHIIVALFLRVGLPLDVSASLLTALCKAGEVWLLITLAESIIGKKGWLATLSGVLCALVTAVWVPVLNAQIYYGIGSPNTWHSPTQLMAMVMMLIILPYTARCVETFQRRLPTEGEKANISWRNTAVLGALLAVSLLAKPTFMQAFFPAACLYFLLMWIKRPKNSPFFWRLLAAAAPSVLMMALQYLFYFGQVLPTQGGMALHVSWDKTADVALSVILTRLFPLFVLLTTLERERYQKPLYQLALLMDAVAIAEMLLVSETGRRAADGNLGWAMMGSALMLWALTLPVFLNKLTLWLKRRKAAAEGHPYLTSHPKLEPLKWATGSLLLLWHAATGIYYVVYMITTTNVL